MFRAGIKHPVRGRDASDFAGRPAVLRGRGQNRDGDADPARVQPLEAHHELHVVVRVVVAQDGLQLAVRRRPDSLLPLWPSASYAARFNGCQVRTYSAVTSRVGGGLALRAVHGSPLTRD